MTGTARAGQLEICVDTPAGVAAAIAGGADRIELCGALEIGGLTPSAGLVAAALEQVRGTGVHLFAMVRPRAGDFAYDRDELALAIAEARALVAQGVDGLAFGAVRDGRVDEATCGRWFAAVCKAAGVRIPCTFHRAIDLVDGPAAAVPVVAALGFANILTSGGRTSAFDGAATIRAMVDRARGTTVAIMAGAGVTPANAVALLAATGVAQLHASASVTGGTIEPRVAELAFALAPRRCTDRATVAALRAILDQRFAIDR